MYTLDTLPIELLHDFVLPCVLWNDLLRLRRTCRALFSKTNAYIKTKNLNVPEVVINGSENQTVKSLFELGFAVSKLFIKNDDGYHYFERNLDILMEFAERFGDKILWLRLSNISAFLYGPERTFLEKLCNLKHLRIDNVDFDIRGEEHRNYMMSALVHENPLGLPLPFSRLETFIIRGTGYPNHDPILLYNISCLRYEQELRCIMLPFSNSLRYLDLAPDFAFQDLIGLHAFFELLRTHIDKDDNTVTCIDFANVHKAEMNNRDMVELLASSLFVQLCSVAFGRNINLNNVGPNWFLMWYVPEVFLDPQILIPQIGHVVKSVRNLTPAMFGLDMINLETIIIKSTRRCNVSLRPGQRRPEWPNLKTLKIFVDSSIFKVQTRKYVPCQQGGIEFLENFFLDTMDLFDFLFRNIVHSKLETLVIAFKRNLQDVTVPNTLQIARACPGLMKLKLVNWPGNNGDLTKFWTTLHHLRHVSITSAVFTSVGDEAFAALDNTGKPAFLNLRALKTLSLKGLQFMHNITDRTLVQIVSKMQLSKLLLTSQAPLQTITLAGIQFLSGETVFAKSIEHFPFNGFTLHHVTSNELSECEKIFRSYNML